MPKELFLELPNLSLAFLLLELKPLIDGGIVEKAQDLENNWVKLKVRSKEGSHDLVFSPNALFIAHYRVSARQQSSGFGAFIRKKIKGKKINSIKQHEFERIVIIDFGSYTLIAELFGKGNLLFLDKNSKILMPFHKRKWSARTLARGKRYSLPPRMGINPKELSLKELTELFKESEQSAIKALIFGVNVPPVIGEEVFARTGIKKTLSSKNLSLKQVKKIHSRIKEFYSGLDLKKEKPCLVVHSNKRVLLPFKPESGIEVLKEFDSINQALNELVLLPFLKPEKEKEKKPQLKRTLKKQKQALEKTKRAVKENKKKAELIYSHYPHLMKAVRELRKLSREKNPKKSVMYKKFFDRVSVKKIDLKKKKAVFKVPGE